MERGTFPHILDAFDDFVVVQLNTSGRPQADFNQALQLRLVGENSLPRYVIMDPKGEKILRSWAYEFQFTRDPKTFASKLADGQRVFARVK